MNIAVIPARGGSKRIPRKNVMSFCGKPMIAYSIDAAKACSLFDHILVSTDDDEIATIAEAYGAEAHFRRPTWLADDHTPTIPVIRHAIDWVDQNLGRSDYICCIYATAPFIRDSDLNEGYKILKDNPDTEFAFSATSFGFPIFRAIKINEDGTTGMFWPEHERTRSQDLPEAYHDAGQFYWGTRNAWINRDQIFSASSRIVKLARQNVQDIDTQEDWEQAEIIFEVLKANHNKK